MTSIKLNNQRSVHMHLLVYVNHIDLTLVLKSVINVLSVTYSTY